MRTCAYTNATMRARKSAGVNPCRCRSSRSSLREQVQVYQCAMAERKKVNRGGELERVRVQQGERKRETEIESESERAQRLSCLVLLWLC